MLPWIQKHIILSLLSEESVRSKEIRPDSVPDNLFSYHISQLMIAGYIARSGRGTYVLTAEGHKYSGTLSTATNNQADNIKTVVMLVSQNVDGEHLMFRWARQPYLGMVTLPHDRMVIGKTLTQSVADLLTNKCGAAPDAVVTYLKGGLISTHHAGVIVSHMYAIVYDIEAELLQLPFVGKNGTALWAKLSDLDATELMSGYLELMNTVVAPGIEPFEVSVSY